MCAYDDVCCQFQVPSFTQRPHAAIVIIIEGRKTAFNGFQLPLDYWNTVEKPETESVYLTLSYQDSDSEWQ